ncbi:MAG: hypothetical protein EOP05_06860 [Proteobacteria bacterium]|nr:MAG: hypothetical protein EOP05_06860 [Pseudomonadota bacterium]
MGIVDRFRSRLEGLELERLKVARDRQTYRFLAFLLTFLSFCSLTAGLWGSSQLVVILGLCLGACAAALWYLRKNLDGAYQIKFREAITREWFQERFRSAYLTPPPEVVSEEALLFAKPPYVPPTSLRKIRWSKSGFSSTATHTPE